MHQGESGRLVEFLKVFPGQDGVVRNVQVKTTKGEYKGSVQRCCPLIEQQEKDT